MISPSSWRIDGPGEPAGGPPPRPESQRDCPRERGSPGPLRRGPTKSAQGPKRRSWNGLVTARNTSARAWMGPVAEPTESAQHTGPQKSFGSCSVASRSESRVRRRPLTEAGNPVDGCQGRRSVTLKTTAYFRDVVRLKHPGIDQAWIQRVLDHPLDERLQTDGRHVLWGLVPEAGNRALRVVTPADRETIHNAFFDRGFRKRASLQPSERQFPKPPGASNQP